MTLWRHLVRWASSSLCVTLFSPPPGPSERARTLAVYGQSDNRANSGEPLRNRTGFPLSLIDARARELTVISPKAKCLPSEMTIGQCSRACLRAAAAFSQSLSGQVSIHQRRVVQVHILARTRKRRRLSIRPTCQHAVAICPARHDNASTKSYGKFGIPTWFYCIPTHDQHERNLATYSTQGTWSLTQPP